MAKKYNLLIGTGTTANSDTYLAAQYKTTEPLVAGNTYTISAYVEELECEGETPRLYVFDNALVWNNYGFLKGDIPGLQTLTFTPNTQQIQGSNPNYISFYNTIPYSDAKRKAVLHHVMMVKGDTPVAWAPAYINSELPWHSFYGTYQHTGPYYNVALVGSPNASGTFGIPLSQAHNKNLGYGILFEQIENTTVKATINLIACAITDSKTWASTSHSYVQYGGRYNWRLQIDVSSNGGKSYTKKIYDKWIFSHADTWGMAYNGSWETTARNSQWTGNLSIPEGTTHVRFLLTGEDVFVQEAVVFTIQEIIPEARPWAVRKGGKFLSCDRATGWSSKRNADGTWKKYTDKFIGGQENVGYARIRHSNKWLGQKKIGE